MIEEVSPAPPSVVPAATALLPVMDPYLRVLHINDSTDDQILFQAACRRGNVPFNWHVADSAEKGISYLKALVEQGKDLPVCWPDLILLDIVMPEVSGLEVLRFIRATPELKHLPVVIFTGDTLARTEEESRELGANLFLLKPVSFQEVVTLARKLYELISQMKEQGSRPDSPRSVGG